PAQCVFSPPGSDMVLAVVGNLTKDAGLLACFNDLRDRAKRHPLSSDCPASSESNVATFGWWQRKVALLDQGHREALRIIACGSIAFMDAREILLRHGFEDVLKDSMDMPGGYEAIYVRTVG